MGTILLLTLWLNISGSERSDHTNNKNLIYVKFVKIVHASIQLCSKQSCPEKTTTTWRGGGLFIEHLTVHIQARHCMGCDIWLTTYRHIIAWRLWKKVLLLFYISPPPSRLGSGLLGGMSSFKPGWLYESNMDNAWWGVLVDVDSCVVFDVGCDNVIPFF